MSKFKNYFVSLLFSSILYACLLWLFIELFAFETSLVLPILIGILVLLSCCLPLEKNNWIIPTIWIVLTILSVLVFWEQSSSRLGLLLNSIIDSYKQVSARNYEIFQVTDTIGITYALSVLSTLLALVSTKAIKEASPALGLVIWLVLGGLSIVFLPLVSDYWLIAAAMTALLLLFRAVIFYKQTVGLSARWISLKVWFRTVLISLLIISILFGIFGLEKARITEVLAVRLSDTVNDLRYGSTDETGLTEGDLYKVGKRPVGNETMLKLTMSDPTSYYLRGFVGEVYKSNRWSELTQESLYKNSQVFYSLHQDGFYAQSQIATVASIIDEDLFEYENSLEIENVALPSKYLYAPYEMMYSDILDDKAIGDSTVYANGFKGRREYSLTAAENLLVAYQKIAALLYEKQGDDDLGDYLQNEAAYNNFAYEQYRQIPSDIDSYLSKKLGDYVIEDGQIHFDYQKAKQNILYYLSGNMVYNEDTSPIKDDIDFILNFLDGSKKGYDVHYASAAVMMFRYYGIPARFAEGYIVTKDEAKNAQPGETLYLDSSHAHAWAEYYQDGIGWLPFEATPNYFPLMEQPDSYQDISGLIGTLPEDEQNEPRQPEIITEKEDPTLFSFLLKYRLTILLLVLILLVLLLIIYFIVWLIRERIDLAKRKKSFISNDYADSICQIFSYIADLIVADGVATDNRSPEDYADLFEEDIRMDYIKAVKIWQEAKFSSNLMSEKQRNHVLELKDVLWKRTWKKSGILQKIQLKFMYFL